MKNQTELDKLLDEMIEETEDALQEVFANRLRALLDQVSEMYRKYSQGGKLTYTDMNRYNRLQKEMDYIGKEIQKDYRKILRRIQNLMETEYVENYLRSAYLYEFEAQVKMGYSIPSAKVIEAAIVNPIPNLTLPKLMKEHRNEIIRKINIEITQGLQAGEDYSTMAERIEKVVGFSSKKARRVARTEASRVQTNARLDSAEQASKHADLEKAWNSTLDTKVRPAHRRLDGQKADEDGYFHYRGMKAQGPHLWMNPSMDINCRCGVIFLVNGNYPEVRRERLKSGGTNVIPWLNYEEWHGNRVA